jgi:serine/threonine protein kinase
MELCSRGSLYHVLKTNVVFGYVCLFSVCLFVCFIYVCLFVICVCFISLCLLVYLFLFVYLVCLLYVCLFVCLFVCFPFLRLFNSCVFFLFRWPQLFDWMFQMVSGLDCLHTEQAVHRDFKTLNIMVKKEKEEESYAVF